MGHENSPKKSGDGLSKQTQLDLFAGAHTVARLGAIALSD
jgi:hypothetical protein